MKYTEENLIWIDLEMSGLQPEHDQIIEIATIVTDAHLTEQVDGPAIAIHHDDEVIDAMDAWNTRHHGQSGLIDRIRKSQYTAAQAEQESLEFLRRYVPPGVSPMCGNSICQDRRFLYKYMPELAEYFHYRNLDVSTLKELAQRWAPALATFQKRSVHVAHEDIRDSIDELKHYRSCFLNVPPPV
jgi:oligoribonuclease